MENALVVFVDWLVVYLLALPGPFPAIAAHAKPYAGLLTVCSRAVELRKCFRFIDGTMGSIWRIFAARRRMSNEAHVPGAPKRAGWWLGARTLEAGAAMYIQRKWRGQPVYFADVEEFEHDGFLKDYDVLSSDTMLAELGSEDAFSNHQVLQFVTMCGHAAASGWGTCTHLRMLAARMLRDKGCDASFVDAHVDEHEIHRPVWPSAGSMPSRECIMRYLRVEPQPVVWWVYECARLRKQSDG